MKLSDVVKELSEERVVITYNPYGTEYIKSGNYMVFPRQYGEKLLETEKLMENFIKNIPSPQSLAEKKQNGKGDKARV